MSFGRALKAISSRNIRDFKKYVNHIKKSDQLDDLYDGKTLLESVFTELKRRYFLGHDAQVHKCLRMIWYLYEQGADFSKKFMADEQKYMRDADLALLYHKNDTCQDVDMRRIPSMQEILRCFAQNQVTNVPKDAHIRIARSLIERGNFETISIANVKQYHGYQTDEAYFEGNGGQTAHFKNAHEAAGQAMMRLLKRYPEINIKTSLLDLFDSLVRLRKRAENGPIEYDVTHRKIDVAIRYMASMVFKSCDSDFYDSVTGLSQQAYTALIWTGLKEDFSWVDDAWVSLGQLDPLTEDFERKLCGLVNAFVNIARGYNPEVDGGDAFKRPQNLAGMPWVDIPNTFDNPTCWGGVYTKMVEAIMGQHPDVPLAYLSFSHNDLAALRRQVFQQCFNRQTPKQRSLIRTIWDDVYDLDLYIHKSDNGCFSMKEDFGDLGEPSRLQKVGVQFLITVNQTLRAEIKAQHGIEGEDPVAVVPRDVAKTGIDIYAFACEALPPADEDEQAFESAQGLEPQKASKPLTPQFDKLKEANLALDNQLDASATDQVTSRRTFLV